MKLSISVNPETGHLEHINRYAFCLFLIHVKLKKLSPHVHVQQVQIIPWESKTCIFGVSIAVHFTEISQECTITTKINESVFLCHVVRVLLMIVPDLFFEFNPGLQFTAGL